MTSSKTGHITRLLEAHRQGEEAAFDQVVEALYEELLLLAHRQRHGAPRDATLNTTGLVHEAYVKMANGTHLDSESSLPPVRPRTLRVRGQRLAAGASPPATRRGAREKKPGVSPLFSPSRPIISGDQYQP